MRAKKPEPVSLTLSVTIHAAPRSPAWSAIWQRLLAPPPKEWPPAQVGQPGEGTEEKSTDSNMNIVIVRQDQEACNG